MELNNVRHVVQRIELPTCTLTLAAANSPMAGDVLTYVDPSGASTTLPLTGLEPTGDGQGLYFADGAGNSGFAFVPGAPALQPGDYWYFYDANGNVGQVLNATAGSNWGAIAAHYEYDAYGTALVRSGPLAQSNAFRFSTKYYDEETGRGLAIPPSTPPPLVQEGLYYYGHRYYSPGMGRWVSRDPIGERGGRNLAAYVENGPTNFVDALGQIRMELWFRAFIHSVHGEWSPEPYVGWWTGNEFAGDNRGFFQSGTARLSTYVLFDSTNVGTPGFAERIYVDTYTDNSLRRDGSGTIYTKKSVPIVTTTVRKKSACRVDVTVKASAAYPFISESPAIDYKVTWSIYRHPGTTGRVLIWASGGHAGFPEYEAYVLVGGLLEAAPDRFYAFLSDFDGPGFGGLWWDDDHKFEKGPWTYIVDTGPDCCEAGGR